MAGFVWGKLVLGPEKEEQLLVKGRSGHEGEDKIALPTLKGQQGIIYIRHNPEMPAIVQLHASIIPDPDKVFFRSIDYPDLVEIDKLMADGVEELRLSETDRLFAIWDMARIWLLTHSVPDWQIGQRVELPQQ